MKKIITLSILIFSLNMISQTADEILTLHKVDVSKILEEDLKRFSKTEPDDFSGVYKIEASGIYKSGSFDLYFSFVDNIMQPRIVIKTTGTGWIFMNKGTLLIEKETFEFIIPDARREVSSGARTVEYIDMPLTEDFINFLRNIESHRTNVKIRLSGDKYRDRSFWRVEKVQTVKFIELYDKLIATKK